MKSIFCPNCGSTDIKHVQEGYFKCNSCGYLGSISNKTLFKS